MYTINKNGSCVNLPQKLFPKLKTLSLTFIVQCISKMRRKIWKGNTSCLQNSWKFNWVLKKKKMSYPQVSEGQWQAQPSTLKTYKCRLFHAKIFKMKSYVSIILGYDTFLSAVCVHPSLPLKKEIVRWRTQVCGAVEVAVLFLWFNYPDTSEISTVQNNELNWLTDGTCSPQSQFRNSAL